MNLWEVKDTPDSTQSVYHKHPSRTTSTWHVFPLAPWCPLGYRTGRDDHVDGNAVKVKGSEEFLSKVSCMLVFGQELGSRHLCVRVDVKAGGRGIQGRGFGNIVVLPLTFLLLQFERDTSHGSLLNSLHEMGCEPSDFIAQTLRGHDSLDEESLVCQPKSKQRDFQLTTSSMMRLFVWKSRVKRG